jgi:glycyl-tRNA synthetase beta chain
MMKARAEGVFFLEIGTEEIPARMLDNALSDLRLVLCRELESGRLLPDGGLDLEENVQTFGTPRRLAIRVSGLRRRQPDVEQEVSGPSVKAAFDASGRPTKAAEGFARSQGIAVKDLLRIASPKGECVAVRKRVPGAAAAAVLSERVPAAVLSISFPKTMRWGPGEFRFVRPIHWVMALLDGDVVEMRIAGIGSGRRTRGHRRLGSRWIEIADPMTYADLLREARVAASVDERRAMVERQLAQAAGRDDGVLAAPPGSPAGAEGDPDLVREVVQAVEWPHVIAGGFDEAFLDLPQEILITAMRHHQKSFSLRSRAGRLLNRFLAVADMDGDPTGAIRRGNEWVLRARLTDARFFWEEDRRTPLRQHAASLERITFHEKLGSYARKCDRMAGLAGPVCDAFAAAGATISRDAVAEAVRLCKADLTTQMVKEFPELEGVVGGLYARADGCEEAVAAAIYAHYQPRGAEDPLPPTAEGSIVTILDRVDTQAGVFLLGIQPTGSRDPYGLRRSVLGTCRVLIENKVRVSLGALIDRALAAYASDRIEAGRELPAVKAGLLEFYRGRLQHLGEAGGRRQDSVRAALAASMDDPYDAWQRMQALDAIREDAGFVSLALAHKRVKNILKDRQAPGYEEARLKEEAERAMDRALRSAAPAIEAAQSRSDHLQALREIARLGPALDRFFNEVMVMVEDSRLRDNRLGLLQAIARLFLRVGDFSEIVVEGEAAPAPGPRAGAGSRPGEGGR